jgi:hypothetical protein
MALTAFAIAILPFLAGIQDPSPSDSIQKERASLLRSALKPYATFQGVDREGRIVLRGEGDADEKTWAVDPEAEIRVQGYWGGLEDLVKGERLWVWARVDRENKPRAVFMIADEISEQDIHQVPYTLASADPAKRIIVIRRKLDGKTEATRSLTVPAAWTFSCEGDDFVIQPASPETALRVRTGGGVYVQTAGEEVVLLAGVDGLSKLKQAQKARMEERWRKHGLPGTVQGIHLLSGEIELALDHEGMRWARSLKLGDRVTLNLEKPIKAAVQEVRPWYERTRLALVSNGRDLADVAVGRRIRVGVAEPAGDLLASRTPPDAGRPREAAARAEWILSSMYCSCPISRDVCTGMFYTLAACNTMTCGMPERVRKFVRPLIEKGLTDKEIFDRMDTEFGAAMWNPHLLR